MVHIYTIGYMHEDPGYNRFFSYISLFTFSMLMLVMANNFMQLFFGWEAVGLVSYLLIGFWYTRPTAIFANMKAFLVNRVGDFGSSRIGLVWPISAAGLRQVFRRGRAAAQINTLGEGSGRSDGDLHLLFIGAMGKTPVPLHVWLRIHGSPSPIFGAFHAGHGHAGIFMVSGCRRVRLSRRHCFVITIGASSACSWASSASSRTTSSASSRTRRCRSSAT
jgi:NADH-quinone oxidoreductase subunit L